MLCFALLLYLFPTVTFKCCKNLYSIFQFDCWWKTDTLIQSNGRFTIHKSIENGCYEWFVCFRKHTTDQDNKRMHFNFHFVFRFHQNIKWALVDNQSNWIEIWNNVVQVEPVWVHFLQIKWCSWIKYRKDGSSLTHLSFVMNIILTSH